MHFTIVLQKRVQYLDINPVNKAKENNKVSGIYIGGHNILFGV